MNFKKSGAVSGKLAARAILGRKRARSPSGRESDETGAILGRKRARSPSGRESAISRRWGNFWLGGRDVAAAGMKFAKIGAKIAKVG